MIKIQQDKAVFFNDDRKMNVLVMPQPQAHSISILCSFRDGVAYETEQEWGISHFLEHLNFKGTPQYPSLTAISSALEGEGGQVSAYSTRDATSFWAKVPPWSHRTAFSVLASLISNTDFKDEAVEQEKPIIIQEMERERANARLYNGLSLEDRLLRPHPMGRSPLGDAVSIEKHKAPEISEYKKRVYCSSNCSLVIAGAIDEDEARDCALTISHAMHEGEAREQSLHMQAGSEDDRRKVYHCEYPGLSQVNIAAGWLIQDPDAHLRWLDWSLVNTLIGVGFSSLLYRRLREEHQLTYLVTTQLKLYEPSGTFRIILDTKPEHVKTSIAHITDIFSELARKGVRKDDFERARAQLWGNLTIRTEDTMEYARILGRRIFMEEPATSLAEIGSTIENLSPSIVEELASRHFTEDTMVVSLAGSAEALGKTGLQK